MNSENETLRWPTNLDHNGIVLRLVQFRDSAQSSGLPEQAALFTNVENMPAGKIATHVVAAITWLQAKPEYRALTMQLEMVAMNLKNLR